MSVPIWTGGVVSTLLLAYVSMLARRWWPLAWLFCIFLGAGAGVILGIGHPTAAVWWWWFWAGYTPTLPIVRLIVARREARRREEVRQQQFSALMVDLDRGDRAMNEYPDDCDC